MDEQRYIRWINASRGLERIEPFMILIAQGLGKLDSQLIEEDRIYCGLSAESRNTEANAIKITDCLILSYLWILGGYELIRTISQRCRNEAPLLGEALAQRVTELKHDFERLRIPLAKMEPASRHRQTDFPIAYPEIHREMGISWRVSEDMHISRQELANRLLALFEDIHNTG
jgi:hypothetical protein